MARPRGRLSKGASASSTPAKKREASPVTPLRQSKRNKSNSATPASKASTAKKKSIYVEPESDLSDLDPSAAESSAYEEEEDGGDSVISSPPESDEESEEYDSESHSGKRGWRKPPKTKVKVSQDTAARYASNSKELWREGAKVDAEPGKEVLIALPKARSAGKTPYRDDTIHPNTFLFLGDLKVNNDREWLKLHDPDFRQSERDWKSFVESLSEKLIEKDYTIPELPPKDLVFRIYRDIRFSKDPTPYKTHFSVAWSRTGRKGPYAHYYLQIGPGQSFVGGGIWMPEAQQLRLIREAIDQNGNDMKSVLKGGGLRKHFLKGCKESDAIKNFIESNKENALKKRPAGFDESHPHIGLLRLRNFTLGKKIEDKDITGQKGLAIVADLLGELKPWIWYLNSIVMPDPNQQNQQNGQDSSEDSSEDDNGENEDEDTGED